MQPPTCLLPGSVADLVVHDRQLFVRCRQDQADELCAPMQDAADDRACKAHARSKLVLSFIPVLESDAVQADSTSSWKAVQCQH